MIIYECLIEVLENLQYTSTEVGKKYITLGLIGNTALPYALNLIPVHYTSFKKPMHGEHFAGLRERGIYLTPATFLETINFKTERFNCQPDRYNLTWKPKSKEKSGARGDQYPDEGNWVMIKRGNKAVFYLISETEEVTLPSYIRLGKFNSKCKLTSTQVSFKTQEGSLQTDLLLRAEDLDPSLEILQYEKIPIQHGMYLRNVLFQGKGYLLKSNYWGKDMFPLLPVGMAFYKASEVKV